MNLPDNIEHCRYCKSGDLRTTRGRHIRSWKHHAVLCTNCRAQGPAHDTEDEAVEAWNEGGKA